jgi:hypothetical protein
MKEDSRGNLYPFHVIEYAILARASDGNKLSAKIFLHEPIL